MKTHITIEFDIDDEVDELLHTVHDHVDMKQTVDAMLIGDLPFPDRGFKITTQPIV